MKISDKTNKTRSCMTIFSRLIAAVYKILFTVKIIQVQLGREKSIILRLEYEYYLLTKFIRNFVLFYYINYRGRQYSSYQLLNLH